MVASDLKFLHSSIGNDENMSVGGGGGENPIFFASDDNYVPYLATALVSIIENTNSLLNFYIIDEGITEKNKEKIKKLYDNIEFLPIDIDKEFVGFEQKVDCWPISIYGRFLIPKLKPNIKRAIYLDCDIILLGDIKEFWEQDLKGKTFGTCFNTCILNKNSLDYRLKQAQIVNYSSYKKYFNSGSLLIDCEKMNVEKLFEVEKKIRDTLTGDQCVLNRYCADYDANINLDMKFNSTSHLCHFAKDGLSSELREMYDYHGVELKTYFKPLVRHFTGFKPWKTIFYDNYNYTSNFFDWWYYCSKTDFYGDCKVEFEKENSDCSKTGFYKECKIRFEKEFNLNCKNKTKSERENNEVNKKRKIKIKLFGVIPFLKIKRVSDNKIKVYLFGLLILKVKAV